MQKITLPILFSAFLLVACAGPGAQQTVDLSVQDQLDVQTTVQAVSETRPELCDTIADEENRGNCQLRVEEEKTFYAAVDAIDSSACNSITNQSLRQKCELEVAEREEEANYAADLRDQQVRISEIVQSGNSAGECEEIGDENFKEQCQINFYLRKASDTQDPSFCDNLNEEDLQNDCLRQIK